MNGPRLYYASIPTSPEYSTDEYDLYPITSVHFRATNAVAQCQARADLGMVCVDRAIYDRATQGNETSIGYTKGKTPPFEDLTLY